MADIIMMDTVRLDSDTKRTEACIRKLEGLVELLEKDSARLGMMWEAPFSDMIRGDQHKDLETLRSIVSGLGMLLRFETEAADKFEHCAVRVSAVVDSIL